MDDQISYLTRESLEELKKEHANLKDIKIPDIARRIDEAKQQGDLSENAEYTQAREDMSWAQGRLQELDRILSNAQVITNVKSGVVSLGSRLRVKSPSGERAYTIVGPQEIDPGKGLISNESPLGEAFLGHKKGDEVSVSVPSGRLTYTILEIS